MEIRWWPAGMTDPVTKGSIAVTGPARIQVAPNAAIHGIHRIGTLLLTVGTDSSYMRRIVHVSRWPKRGSDSL